MRADDDLPLVQHGDGPLEAAQRLGELQAELHDEVAAAPLERPVLPLVQDDDDVSGLQPRLLVSPRRGM